MKKITEAIESLVSFAQEHRKIVVGLIALFFVLYVGATVGLPALNNKIMADKPITAIKVENNKTYKISDTIKESDFKVKVVHEGGAEEQISASEDTISLSTTKLNRVGAKTKVSVSLVSDPSISSVANVQVKRDKIIGFHVGYPNADDVIAIVYSNGELAFEGSGDVMVFNKGDYPWNSNNYEESKDHPITAISFDDEVTPTNMDYWFQGLETLTYISPIPNSVKTMVGTFADCTNLKNTGNWSENENLVNINQTYSNCTNLEYAFALPASAKTGIETFANCENLVKSPDMSNAASLKIAEGMFKNCLRLNEISMAPALTNMKSMFQNCINLKDMPTIPETVEEMSNAFSDCTSLENLTTIPASVISMQSTFANCPYINGDLTINCNAEKFSSMFSGSAEATVVNLVGSSKLLDAYANTSDYNNVVVNGQSPNPEINSMNDVEEIETAKAEQADPANTEDSQSAE